MAYIAAADVPAGSAAPSKAAIVALMRDAYSIKSVADATARAQAATDWPTLTGAAIGVNNPVMVYRQDTKAIEVSENGTTWDGLRSAAYRCVLSSTAAVSAGSGSIIAVPWNTENEDPYAMHAAGTNVVNVNASGLWDISGAITYGAIASGAAYCWLTAASVDYPGIVVPSVGALAPTVTVHAVVRLTAGDAVQLYGVQSSSGTVNITKARLSLVWLSN